VAPKPEPPKPEPPKVEPPKLHPVAKAEPPPEASSKSEVAPPKPPPSVSVGADGGSLVTPAKPPSTALDLNKPLRLSPLVANQTQSWRAPLQSNLGQVVPPVPSHREYPDTPSIMIGVNQSSRSPLKMEKPIAAGPPPQPTGGLFHFYLPPLASTAGNPPTARDRFVKNLDTEQERLAAVKKSDELITPLSDEHYVTPRAKMRENMREKSRLTPRGTVAEVADGAIAKAEQRGSRVAAYRAFFEQFTEALSA